MRTLFYPLLRLPGPTRLPAGHGHDSEVLPVVRGGNHGLVSGEQGSALVATQSMISIIESLASLPRRKAAGYNRSTLTLGPS